jgi:hypothetical protein
VRVIARVAHHRDDLLDRVGGSAGLSIPLLRGASTKLPSPILPSRGLAAVARVRGEIVEVDSNQTGTPLPSELTPAPAL